MSYKSVSIATGGVGVTHLKSGAVRAMSYLEAAVVVCISDGSFSFRLSDHLDLWSRVLPSMSVTCNLDGPDCNSESFQRYCDVGSVTI